VLAVGLVLAAEAATVPGGVGPGAARGWSVLDQAWAAERSSAQVVVKDALTVPSRPARIEARVIRQGLLRVVGLGGERLTLFVDGKEVGTALSGGDGRAFFEHAVPMRGNHVIRVRITGSPRVQDAEGQAVLASWERRRPILFVDMSALVERPATPRLPLPPELLDFAGGQRPKPVPLAAEELTKLTAFYYNPIYLTRSGVDQMTGAGDVREWLREHQFPTGLWMAIPPGPEALAAKLEELEEAGWENLKAGIGASREFAEVLGKHRLETVFISDEADPKSLPRKVRVVKDWAEVRDSLQR
ncbi:MAG: hypothetical protein ACREI3_01860, partial [Nitrospirales bacterium]